MRKIILCSLLVIAFGTADAQTFGNTIKGILKGNSGSKGGSTSGSGFNLNNLSNADVVAGLREALSIGTDNATKRLNTVNGFFGNAVIKVLMPPEAKKVENTLRAIGMGSVVDKAILSMNRAAEDASGKAAPIFIDAIKKMNIQDGINILRNGNGAATAYLRSNTTAALTAAFRPVIENSLKKVDATAMWNTVFSNYNRLPTTVNKINPDLTSYVTERALNGIFVQIAEEENKIRTNPAARVTDLLQRVFGAK